jgi:hypothetical protein
MTFSKSHPLILLATSAIWGFTSLAHAATVEIEITNLTQGIYLTPFIVATHSTEHLFFEVGTEASSSLQSMAEGGNIIPLAADADATGATVVENPHGGLLAPGQKVTSFSIEASDGAKLSLAAMLLPTNDGFAGVDSWPIPSQSGKYTILVNAYDAGTEINDELIVAGAGGPGQIGIPADPTGQAGTNGSGVTNVEQNTSIHIHRGSLGDDISDGGASDLDNRIHRWLNPVLKVTVKVN